MGSRQGVLKTAAQRLGLSEQEYADKVNAGLLHCYRCQDWHPASAFAIDRSRMRGRTGSCSESRNAAERRLYARRQRRG